MNEDQSALEQKIWLRKWAVLSSVGRFLINVGNFICDYLITSMFSNQIF